MAQSIATLVGDLYGCLLREKPETRALDLLCSAVGARHAVIMRVGHFSARNMTTSHHLSADHLVSLECISLSTEYAQVMASVPPGAFSRMTSLQSRQQLGRSQTYQQALRPLDGGLAACGLRFDGADLMVAAVCRSLRSDPDFDDEALALLELCLPHLMAVMALGGRMEQERSLGRSALDALDIVQDGVIILGAHGATSHVNPVAEAMLARGDRLRRSRHGVVADDPADDRKLQQAIQAARRMPRGRGGDRGPNGVALMPRVVLGKRRPGWPLVATVLPAHHAMLGGCDTCDVMLHLVDPGSALCLPLRTLRGEFGLTAQEAALTWQLAQGATLPESARALGISPGTARQYLKVVFQKVGVNSQADLLRVVRR